MQRASINIVRPAAIAAPAAIEPATSVRIKPAVVAAAPAAIRRPIAPIAVRRPAPVTVIAPKPKPIGLAPCRVT